MKRTSWVLVVACAALGVPSSLVQAQATRSARPVEVYEASITDLQEAMASGRTTSAALVEAYLARIAAYDRRVALLDGQLYLSLVTADQAPVQARVVIPR